MELLNNYYYFQKAISKEQCNLIKKYGEGIIEDNKKNGQNVSAFTFGENDKYHKSKQFNNSIPQNEKTLEKMRKENIDKKNTYVRDSEVCWLNDKWIYDLIIPFVVKSNALAGWNFEFSCQESIQFTKYNNLGFYGWHKDGGSDHHAKYKKYIHGVSPDPLTKEGNIPQVLKNKSVTKYTDNINHVGKVRKLSVTVNLSEENDYEGGNLMFDFSEHNEISRYEICEKVRPQGSIIVFPSFVSHCVTPVTKGTRYSLVIWNLGEPFK